MFLLIIWIVVSKCMNDLVDVNKNCKQGKLHFKGQHAFILHCVCEIMERKNANVLHHPSNVLYYSWFSLHPRIVTWMILTCRLLKHEQTHVGSYGQKQLLTHSSVYFFYIPLSTFLSSCLGKTDIKFPCSMSYFRPSAGCSTACRSTWLVWIVFNWEAKYICTSSCVDTAWCKPNQGLRNDAGFFQKYGSPKCTGPRAIQVSLVIFWGACPKFRRTNVISQRVNPVHNFTTIYTWGIIYIYL